MLLALDEEKGRSGFASDLSAVLAGALLIDLVDAGHLREEDGKLIASDRPAPAAQPLADALAKVADSHKPRDAKYWVSSSGLRSSSLERDIAAGLARRGILREERRKLLGVVSTTRFPEADPEPERRLRERLSAVLLGEREPDQRSAALVALLKSINLLTELVPRELRKEADRRADDLLEPGSVGSAAERSMRDTQVAAITAGVAGGAGATVVGGDGGGGGS